MTEADTNGTIKRPITAAERLREAEDVRDELWAALHAAGVTLPSLCVEPAAYADAWPRPLVELGRCNLETARLLTSALKKEGAA
ncbi:hypothetical protein [Streptomyces odontomachi]|uniref:hypothetical protein n=1 Tax=Streptomyces odontomachi TaxID=2944940 RepID=UPI00210DAAF7|nr:hypothetical protein [Streptomyces sp. ODS25]